MARSLGWRITAAFVQNFFGRVFSDPASVFPGDMLRPEEQSMDDFAAGVEHIVEAQQKAALMYFEESTWQSHP